MDNPILPTKTDLNGNPTAGTFKTAIGQLYDYIVGAVMGNDPRLSDARIAAGGNADTVGEKSASDFVSTHGGVINGSTMAGTGLLVTGNVGGGIVGDYRFPGTGFGAIAVSGYANGDKSAIFASVSDTSARISKTDGNLEANLNINTNGNMDINGSALWTNANVIQLAGGGIKFPNGFMIQRGITTSLAPDMSRPVTFPVAFVSAPFVSTQVFSTTGNGYITSPLNTGFTLISGSSSTQNYSWMASGF